MSSAISADGIGNARRLGLEELVDAQLRIGPGGLVHSTRCRRAASVRTVTSAVVGIGDAALQHQLQMPQHLGNGGGVKAPPVVDKPQHQRRARLGHQRQWIVRTLKGAQVLAAPDQLLGKFSKTTMLSNSGCPRGTSLQFWISTSGAYTYWRSQTSCCCNSCSQVSSVALGVARTRIGRVLINTPTILSLPANSAGRPVH